MTSDGLCKRIKNTVWPMKCKNSERGVTLIELILYMGIFSILLMVLVELFGTIVNVNLEAQATSAVSQDGRYILNQLTYTIRQAKTFTNPSSLGVTTIGAPDGTAILQFTTTGGTTYKYSLTTDANGNEDLDINDGVSTEQLNSIGTSVTAFNVTRYATSGTSSDNSITIGFTLKSTTREEKGYQTENFQTTVGKRY